MALVVALAVAGFVVARLIAEHDARRDSERRAEVAAAQIRGRLGQAASLTESLRRFMLNSSGTGVTSDQFARNALRWLSPADFPAAAWVERIPDPRRSAYERGLGQPIVTPDDRRSVVARGSRPSYLPATLVSGFSPMAVPGIDLGGEPGMATALARATRVDGVAATAPARPGTQTNGVFLVGPAPNLVGTVLRPGYVVVFVSDATLRAAATGAPAVRITSGGASSYERQGSKAATRGFAVAGRRFDVAVPVESVHGAAAVLPWIILAAGLGLAALVAALGVNRARRAKAQADLDRVFTLSNDVIAVANFDGYFTRVNPAAERILGYTREELLARPYSEFVHPDDRGRTDAETSAIGHGRTAVAFENRYIRKDGSERVLEWTSTPVVEEGVSYSVARDVTDRRRAESEVERLAEEQAALRRVATVVARDASQAEVFAAVAEECGRLFGEADIGMVRYEGGDTQFVVASSGTFTGPFPVGTRQPLGGMNAASRLFETGMPVRIDDYAPAGGPIGDAARSIGVRSVVATPIMVEGRLWGAMILGTTGSERLPSATEYRLGQLTELMATAIANTESKARADRLADEQAALRRVATLVAEGASAAAVFEAVAAEMERLLDSDGVTIGRYEPDDELTLVAHIGPGADQVPAGTRTKYEGENVAAKVRRSARPARMEDFAGISGPIADIAKSFSVRAAVGAPIVVDGRLWGVVVARWNGEELPPPDTEQRMAEFAELLETAIANADSRDQLVASRARLMTAGDDARRRVVRDLHDGVQQRMVHTIVTLKLARRALDQEDGNVESLVGEALEFATRGSEELRELAHGILPGALTRGGLRAAVEDFVSRLLLPVEVDVCDERFSAEIEASAYFIVAEALTNVVKHARAPRAEVRASVHDARLHVYVRDQGIGGADPGGHGLLGMADRAAALGGRLTIDTPLEGGTLIAAALPLTPRGRLRGTPPGPACAPSPPPGRASRARTGGGPASS